VIVQPIGQHPRKSFTAAFATVAVLLHSKRLVFTDKLDVQRGHKAPHVLHSMSLSSLLDTQESRGSNCFLQRKIPDVMIVVRPRLVAQACQVEQSNEAFYAEFVRMKK
jgi:hypothetical protein